MANIENLKRWSCLGKEQRDLPPSSKIKAIHIYDFDNTLFNSPLPNAKLWTHHTIGLLQEEKSFVNGGWWHDNRLLESTGQGLEQEEPRAWEGWWNEEIVRLVELSMREEEALTVLLTGRGEKKFSNIINRMIRAKKLVFDMVCLKPAMSSNGRPYPSTMAYKQTLIRDLVANYQGLDEVKIYEDRPKHTAKFREFLNELNLELLRGIIPGASRKQFAGDVVQVPTKTVTLDPVTEAAEVQNMINLHNSSDARQRWQMKRTIFFTGYLLSQRDADNLISLLDQNLLKSSDIKVLANNIMITPKPATESVLDKVGGLGAKQIWQVTALGNWDGVVYAAKVQPIPPSATVTTESATPMVVLATLRGAKAVDSQRITNWQPVATEKQFVFETTVGEKVQLRIDPENDGESEYDSYFPKSQPGHGTKRRGNEHDRRTSGNFRGRGSGRERDRGDRRDRRDRELKGGNARGGGSGSLSNSRPDRNQRKQQQRANNAYRSLDENGATYNQNFPPLGGQGSQGGPPRDAGGGNYGGAADDGGLHY